MIIIETLPKKGNLGKEPIDPRPIKVHISSYVNIEVSTLLIHIY